MAKQIKKQNPFQVEIDRDILATQKKYKELQRTYTSSFAQIPDHNTPIMWDEINLSHKKIGDHPMEDDRIRIVSRWIKEKSISVFNIGFGSANLEREYFQRHSHSDVSWKGIDISSKSVTKAKKEFLLATFSIGNMLQLREKDNSFDYVVSLEVLEHIQPSNTMKALKEIYRVIKPGGYFIVSVPLNEGLEKMIARGENPNAHVRIYTPDLIKAELGIIGFTIKKEKVLYAFHSFYKAKSVLADYIFKRKYKPNNIILLAQKPM